MGWKSHRKKKPCKESISSIYGKVRRPMLTELERSNVLFTAATFTTIAEEDAEKKQHLVH
jgi:hypothetical protein